MFWFLYHQFFYNLLSGVYTACIITCAGSYPVQLYWQDFNWKLIYYQRLYILCFRQYYSLFPDFDN